MMAGGVTVAVVGLGQRGLQHLKALWTLQERGDVNVVALCDASSANLAAEKIGRFVSGYDDSSLHASTDFADVIAQKPDAVYFAIPPGLHDGQVLQAIRAGIHIFAEKPMSLFLDEAKEQATAVEAAGVISTCGFQRRYESQSVTVHDFLADKRTVITTCVVDGYLEAHSVKHTDTTSMGGPTDKVWAKNFEWSGATIVEAGIHQTDLMRFWMGDISWVQAAYVPRDADDIEDGGDNPYAYTVTYGFENGAVGNLLMSRLRKVYHSDGYQIIMWDHGHLKLEGDGVVAYYYDGPYPPEARPLDGEVRHPVPTPPKVDTNLAISSAFVDAIRSGDSSKMLSTYSSSMNSLAAVLAANVSHFRGGERIDLRAFTEDAAYAEYRVKKPRN
jgi:predicted dehydrogenase